MKNNLWAMEEHALAECLERYNTAVQDPEQIKMFLDAQESMALQTTYFKQEKETHTAIIDINGVLTPNYTFMTWLMGGTAYSQILLAIDQAEHDESVDSVIFDFDTGGGAVNGVEAVGIAIKQMKKPNVGFVRGTAASAGYYLASATSKLYGLEMSEVGSVGVVISVVDTTERDKKEGVKRYEITSKNAPEKRPDISKKSGREILQKRVDDTEDVLISHIATNRGVTSDTVRSDFGHGGMMLFAEAIEANMVDDIKNFDLVRAEISQIMENDMEMKDLSLELLRAERHDLVEAILEDGKKEGATAERDRLSALDSLKGSVEEANKIIDEAKADGRSATDITLDVLKAERTHVQKIATDASVDLEADAKKMAVVSVSEAPDPDEAAELAAELEKFRGEK